MMNKVAIKAENISKQYRLGEVGTGTISHDLNRWFSKIRGKEDPFLKIGEVNDRSLKSNNQYVWSLKDINFEINQGDTVGIIGKNGAGKSTLLKLLSKITKPTTGQFKINGRIASLLEVGTGFHPEMTGRENIFLNGAILGMRRSEIKSKFDEIVDFAGIERYVDTPVKRYSSGMYVRLAFAVAAHLESEILIVDEVLAVGDMDFQKKCLGKMEDISQQDGRTILLVSHNISNISKISNKILLLENGMLVSQGNDVAGIITKYLTGGDASLRNQWINNDNQKYFQDLLFESAEIYNNEGKIKSNFINSENIFIKLKIKKTVGLTNLVIAINLCKPNGEFLLRGHFDDYNLELEKFSKKSERFEVIFSIPKYFLATGDYIIKFDIGIHCIRKVSDSRSDLDLIITSNSEIGDRFHYLNSDIGNSVIRPNLFNSINYL